MKRWKAIVLGLFALTTTGAKDCGGGWWSSSATKSTSPPPEATLPFCLSDPPPGCAAVCTAPDLITFTPACSSVDAGPRELGFEMTIMENAAALMMQGGECTIGFTVTPCALGLAPVEWPNQDHTVCMSAPAGCVL